MRNQTAIAGIGESAYYKRGQAPKSEFLLTCEAILAAVEDAGLAVSDIDGFASYGDDRNLPMRLAAALGVPDVAFANMVWEGRGGGCAGAIGNAAAVVSAGLARHVVVYRGLCQGKQRMGTVSADERVTHPHSYTAPFGHFVPAHHFAFRVRRFMHEYGVTEDTLAEIALISYHHAQHNPRAVMYGRPLTRAMYDDSPWVTEPFRRFDCALETDGAAAAIVTTAERARDLKQTPAYILGVAQGSDYRQSYSATVHNAPDYASANFKSVARRLYAMAGIDPADVDVAQIYENFTGGVLMSIVEHGLCAPEEASEFIRFDRLTWPNGALPMNTSGGHLAECYLQGMAQVNEAVRQLRGTADCQVADAQIALVASGPMVQTVSNMILARTP